MSESKKIRVKRKRGRGGEREREGEREGGGPTLGVRQAKKSFRGHDGCIEFEMRGVCFFNEEREKIERASRAEACVKMVLQGWRWSGWLPEEEAQV
jgi:hypothetical protein